MAITLNDEKLTGLILASISNTIPEGFLLCNGSAINRTIYSSLFALSPSTTSTVTMTIASPCVVTWDSHGLATGQSIQFSTTGSLPTFSTIQSVYFIRTIDTNTFHLYDTLANAMNTAATTGRINTSGTQSGIHTALVYYWGNGDGSTTFNIPDAQGTFLRGAGTSNGYIENVTIALGAKTDDAFQGHHHIITSLDRYDVISTAGADSTIPAEVGPVARQYYANNPTTDDVNGTPRIGSETRVKSVAVNYFIKF